ncbi:MAG: non-heme iron oxygenase ferredoxin subunit [Planctomycetaceae bacterium]
MSNDFEKIANLNEIANGERKSVIIDDIPALLIRQDDNYYAIEDVCTHDGQPLTEGPINGCEITCPRHGARFDLRTGAALCMPATEPITTFEIEVRDDGIYAKPND